MTSLNLLRSRRAVVRHLVLGAGLAGGLITLPAARAASPAKPGGVREIKWEELVPAGWDPSKTLKGRKDILALQDGDPKVTALMKEVREIWDNAPTRAELEGRKVRLPGYLVPLEGQSGDWKEFLVVPYFGACVHSPPPPANQIVHVKAAIPGKGLRSMDTVMVTGTLRIKRSDTDMGVSGYLMDGASVEKYTEPPLPSK